MPATGAIIVPELLGLLKDKEPLKPGQRCLRVTPPKMVTSESVWDSGDIAQINEAKALFDQLIQEGLVPYKVGLDGKATVEVMEEFDPDAEEVIFLAVAAVVTGG